MPQSAFFYLDLDELHKTKLWSKNKKYLKIHDTTFKLMMCNWSLENKSNDSLDWEVWS